MAPENQTLHLPNVQLFSSFSPHFQIKKQKSTCDLHHQITYVVFLNTVAEFASRTLEARRLTDLLREG